MLPADAAPSAFDVNRVVAGLSDTDLAPESDEAGLVLLRARTDARGWTHLRLAQRYAGLEVFEWEVLAHIRPDGVLEEGHVEANFFRNIEVDPVPGLLPQGVLEVVALEVETFTGQTVPPKLELMVVAAGDGPRLAWRVRLFLEGAAQPSMLLQDIDYRSHGTFDGIGEGSNSTSNCIALKDSDNVWFPVTSSTIPVANAAVEVQENMRQTLDYMRYELGRNGVDSNLGPGYCNPARGGTKKPLSSRVHHGSKYSNAFWNGTFMTYGDGDGTNFGPLRMPPATCSMAIPLMT